MKCGQKGFLLAIKNMNFAKGGYFTVVGTIGLRCCYQTIIMAIPGNRDYPFKWDSNGCGSSISV